MILSNNLNNEYDVSPVLFFRNGKSYYYNFNGKTHEVNSITINKLKETLSVPFKVQFSGLSKVQMRSIIRDLLDRDLLDSAIEVKMKKINTETNNLLTFEALFIRQKKYIEAYKVPNVSSLYSRKTNCNPFLYTSVNSKKILIEVPKDYVKENIGDYYFLSYDLDRTEREFFDSQYVRLEYDYIYKMEKNLSSKKTIQKSLRKKFNREN